MVIQQQRALQSVWVLLPVDMLLVETLLVDSTIDSILDCYVKIIQHCVLQKELTGFNHISMRDCLDKSMVIPIFLLHQLHVTSDSVHLFMNPWEHLIKLNIIWHL